MWEKGVMYPKVGPPPPPALALIPSFGHGIGFVKPALETLGKLKPLAGFGTLPKEIREALRAPSPIPALDQMIDEKRGLRLNTSELREGDVYLYTVGDVNLLFHKVDEKRIEVFEVHRGIVE